MSERRREQLQHIARAAEQDAYRRGFERALAKAPGRPPQLPHAALEHLRWLLKERRGEPILVLAERCSLCREITAWLSALAEHQGGEDA